MSRWFEDYGYAEVADGLLIGAYPQDAGDVRLLSGEEVTRVLNLVEDDEYEEGARAACVAALAEAGIVEERTELVDHGRLDAEALDHGVRVVGEWLDEGERVYLHCRAGWQRSAAFAAATIAIRDGVNLLEALERIRTARPEAGPLVHQREDLATWWSARFRAG